MWAPLTPIPVSDPFDRVGVHAVQLPVSDRGNKYAAAFIDYMSNGQRCMLSLTRAHF